MKSIFLKTAVTAVLMGGTAVAFGAPPEGKGPPEGHGPPTAELSNNLSVPTIMIGGAFTGVTCSGGGNWSTLVEPSGDPLNGFEIDPEAHFFVQRESAWQAPCMTPILGTTVYVTGAWGDNLSGDAKLKVGSPIRVELVLEDAAGLGPQYGYIVDKLEPSLLDRESAYGTLAGGNSTDGWFATTTDMVPGVYAAGTMLRIENVDTGAIVVNEPATAEINAKGRVVYGYNLRVQSMGDYQITYTLPGTVVFAEAGCDAGTCADNAASLVITVIGGGGGGGGKPNR